MCVQPGGPPPPSVPRQVSGTWPDPGAGWRGVSRPPHQTDLMPGRCGSMCPRTKAETNQINSVSQIDIHCINIIRLKSVILPHGHFCDPPTRQSTFPPHNWICLPPQKGRQTETSSLSWVHTHTEPPLHHATAATVAHHPSGPLPMPGTDSSLRKRNGG